MKAFAVTASADKKHRFYFVCARNQRHAISGLRRYLRAYPPCKAFDGKKLLFEAIDLNPRFSGRLPVYINFCEAKNGITNTPAFIRRIVNVSETRAPVT